MIESELIWEIDAIEEDTGTYNKQIHPIVLQLLAKRGLKNPKEITRFLYPKLEYLYNPMLMKDMDKATLRIKKALTKNEKITIYGDYDVDGITSCCILVKLIRKLGGCVDYYIPLRADEGYGLNKEAIENISLNGTSLIITVDNGIGSYDEVEYAKSLGIDVIITDHHETKEKLPKAVAIVNPKQKDCRYPFKELAGVGIALKLALALTDNDPLIIEEFLDLATLGTVADIVPLLDENRIIVKNGLHKLENTSNKGLRALLDRLNLTDKPIDTTKISFMIAPRINAVGRIADAKIAMQLLLTEDKQEAFELAKTLDTINRKRQSLESEILGQAKTIIEKDFDLDLDKVLVLSNSNWNPGVIGIVASKLSDIYNRPCILISEEGIEGRGSGRSIQGFNLFKALDSLSNLLEKYGGHEQAAGLSIKVENIDVFRKQINDLAKNVLEERLLVPKLTADMEIAGEDINLSLAKQLELLEPFGHKNPQPVFISKNLTVKRAWTVGADDKHLKLNLKKKRNSLEAIGFNFGNFEQDLKIAPIIDLAFFLEVNRWNGIERHQMNIRDIKILYLRDEFLFKMEKEYYTRFFSNLSNLNDISSETSLKVDELHNLKLQSQKGFRKKLYVENLLRTGRKLLVVFNTPYRAWQLFTYLYQCEKIKDYIQFSFGVYPEISDDCLITILINPWHKVDLRDENIYDDIIFYDTPFSFTQLSQRLEMVNSSKTHLIFDKEDLRYNKMACEKMLPDVDGLRKAFILLKKMTSNKFFGEINIGEFNRALRDYFYIDLHSLGVINIFKVFHELKLIDFEVQENIIKIYKYIKPKHKLSLKSSNTYCNLLKLKQEVDRFYNFFI